MTQHRERLLSFSPVASVLMAFYYIYLIGFIYTLFRLTLLIQIFIYTLLISIIYNTWQLGTFGGYLNKKIFSQKKSSCYFSNGYLL